MLNKNYDWMIKRFDCSLLDSFFFFDLIIINLEFKFLESKKFRNGMQMLKQRDVYRIPQRRKEKERFLWR